jgi:hypothetical protein
MTIKKEGSGAPIGASDQCGRPVLCFLSVAGEDSGGGTARASSGTRSPFGAPQRRLQQRANAATQPRPRFTRAGGRERYPRRQSRLSQAPGAPVVMPGGTIPEPPESGLRIRPRNRTRSTFRIASRKRPLLSEIRSRNLYLIRGRKSMRKRPSRMRHVVQI